jgi:hypothetical protein
MIKSSILRVIEANVLRRLECEITSELKKYFPAYIKAECRLEKVSYSDFFCHTLAKLPVERTREGQNPMPSSRALLMVSEA